MTQDSALRRFWNSLKPPPPLPRAPLSPEERARKKRQKWLIIGTLAAVALLGGGVAAYNYMQKAPQRSEKEFQDGMKLMRPGTYAQAIPHLTRALDHTGRRAEIYLQRGRAHRFAGEEQAALADFQSAVDVDPSLEEAHNGMAMIYLAQRDVQKAMGEFDKSLALQPNIEGYFQRGELLDSMGEHRKAIDDFDRAIAQARDAPYMYRARARAKDSLGDVDGAQEDRRIAARLEHR